MDNKALIDSLLNALSFSPNNVPLRLQIADLLVKDGEFDKAIEQYTKIIEIEPNNAPAKFLLAQQYYNVGKISVAAVLLDELLAINDSVPDFLLLLAKIQHKEGNKEECLNTYQKLLSINPLYTDEELDNVYRTPSNDALFNIVEEIEDGFSDYMISKPDVNFSHVGGLEDIKKEVNLKIIAPFKNPDLFKMYGKKAGGGILLYGPPGCGKTFLAKATAGEINANFFNVGISDILDMWIGNSEKNLHNIFELARRKKPCVLFFDEVDALGANRNDMKNSAGRQVINQFLAELDGVDTDNEGVLILAATNAPWHLDPAFRRPGRFDRILFVAPPDAPARVEMFKSMLADKPITDIDYNALAKITDGYSGADIKSIIDKAIEGVLEQVMLTGNPIPLTTNMLLAAAKKSVPSTSEWLSTAKNYAVYSNEAGQYDEILKYLKLKK